MTDYKDIRTLDELSAAISANKARIEAQGQSVRSSLDTVQEFYTPKSLALQGVRQAALHVNFYSNALTIVRTLKQRLEK